MLLPTVTPPTLLCIVIYSSQSNSSSAVGTLFYEVLPDKMGKGGVDVVCTQNSSGSSSSAPPAENQSISSRSSRFLLSSVSLHHPHYCYVSCGAKVALSVLIEMLEKILVRSYTRGYLDRLHFITAVPGTYCSTTPCRNTVVELYSYRVPWSNPADLC